MVCPLTQGGVEDAPAHLIHRENVNVRVVGMCQAVILVNPIMGRLRATDLDIIDHRISHSA